MLGIGPHSSYNCCYVTSILTSWVRVRQSEDKRVLKSSSSGSGGVSGPVTSSTARLTSSLRHGLSQWLQRSRAPSSATSTNNNVVGGGGARRGSAAARRSAAAAAAAANSGGPGGGVSSAPISISIVSNHGHVRTLAPNSFGKAATTGAAETTTTGDDAADAASKTLTSITSTTDQCSKCRSPSCVDFQPLHSLLRPPCVADADPIFSSCGFFFLFYLLFFLA